LNYTNKIFYENELYILLNTQILKEIVLIPFNESNIFIEVSFFENFLTFSKLFLFK
jgi:hypothetical protein